MKKRGSPDFRSPEVGISELVLIGLQRTGPSLVGLHIDFHEMAK